MGLKSAKYGQEYRDFGALKSAKIVQTLVGASRGLLISKCGPYSSFPTRDDITTTPPPPPPPLPSSVIILISHPLCPYYPTLTLRFHNAFPPFQVARRFVSAPSIRNPYRTNLTGLRSYPSSWTHQRRLMLPQRGLTSWLSRCQRGFMYPCRQPKDGTFLL